MNLLEEVKEVKQSIEESASSEVKKLQQLNGDYKEEWPHVEKIAWDRMKNAIAPLKKAMEKYKIFDKEIPSSSRSDITTISISVESNRIADVVKDAIAAVNKALPKKLTKNQLSGAELFNSLGIEYTLEAGSYSDPEGGTEISFDAVITDARDIKAVSGKSAFVIEYIK